MRRLVPFVCAFVMRYIIETKMQSMPAWLTSCSLSVYCLPLDANHAILVGWLKFSIGSCACVRWPRPGAWGMYVNVIPGVTEIKSDMAIPHATISRAMVGKIFNQGWRTAPKSLSAAGY